MPPEKASLWLVRCCPVLFLSQWSQQIGGPRSRTAMRSENSVFVLQRWRWVLYTLSSMCLIMVDREFWTSSSPYLIFATPDFCDEWPCSFWLSTYRLDRWLLHRLGSLEIVEPKLPSLSAPEVPSQTFIPLKSSVTSGGLPGKPSRMCKLDWYPSSRKLMDHYYDEPVGM